MASSTSGNRALLRLLREALLPVYLLDNRLRIAFCNDAFANWVGIDAEALIGGDCQADLKLSRLVPPVAGERPPHNWYAMVPAEGDQWKSRKGWSIAIPDADGEPQSTLVVLSESNDAPEPPAEASDPSPAWLRKHLAELQSVGQVGELADAAVGESSQATRIRMQIAAAAGSWSPVVVSGPTGSRRRQVVNAIHERATLESPVSLHATHCRLLDAELLQSTIRAAGSAAAKNVTGRVALLLLDAEELPQDAQQELLGFFKLPDFQLRTFATTRQPLRELVASGALHPDLAELLSVVEIDLPPLADRVADLAALAQHHIESFNASHNRQISHVDEEALDRLALCPWEGGFREFADVMTDACVRAVDGVVGVDELPKYLEQAIGAALFAPRAEAAISLDDFMSDVEAELIRRALAAAKGNRAEAARLLQISRARLLRRIDQLGLDAETPGDA